jgi:phosphoribosylformylglycinamidine synthase subunit PurQ / glutaminase
VVTPALVLTAPGTNRDSDAVHALSLAGANVEVASVEAVCERPTLLTNARLVMLAGGFSYADQLGSGGIWALDVMHRLGDGLRAHVDAGRPVLGVCNGFQALVRAGVLPGTVTAGLAPNASGHFECRWVTLSATSTRCVWTRNLIEPLECPVAHGEGRFVVGGADDLKSLQDNDQVALRYASNDYGDNPNGSIDAIAGVCDTTGLVLGLMPHPEDHVMARQHPRAHRRARDATVAASPTGLCLSLFAEGVRYGAAC